MDKGGVDNSAGKHDLRRASLPDLFFMLVLICPVLLAQQGEPGASGSPRDLIRRVCYIEDHTSLQELSDEIGQTLKSEKAGDAVSYFCLAERMERVGDYRAPGYYEKAIQADEGEPNYEVFYADYLRNFRGASGPLFPQAEEHYFAALRKLRLRGQNQPREGETDTERFIKRGLSALYQQDGVALLYWKSDLISGTQFLERPFLFFSSIDRAAQSDADLDREADIRDYTSEALFAESSMIPGKPGTGRLGRPLTKSEARALIRLKKPFETLDRVRFRYRTWPVIDVFYTHRQTDNDQVTNFFCVTPTSSSGCAEAGLRPFNELRQNDYGVKLQKPFTALRYFDVSVSGTFKRTQRWGLIEFFPGAKESINDYEARTAIAHFFGADKASVDFGYTYQGIHPNVANEPDRDRQFADVTVTYSVFRPLPFIQPAYRWRFETRGWDFFSGTLADIESFPPIHARRHDYFVGTSLKGVGPFDFTVQPTWFTSRVEGDPFQHNTQYRTNANILIRLVDEERNAGIPAESRGPHLAFLHLVVPFRGDTTQAGPNWFENRAIGAELDSKFFTFARWTTFLGSVRYDRLNFYRLDRNVNAFTLNLSLGF